MTHPQKPTLHYDGDCEFCLFWIERWKHHTKDKITYLPFKDKKFKSIQLVLPEGKTRTGAHAVFSALALASYQKYWLWLYRKLPLFADLSELVYRLIAKNRRYLTPLNRLLWGNDPTPPAYAGIRTLFFRLLGLIYFIAFISLFVQIPGLIGEEGILPAHNLLDTVAARLSRERFWFFPTLAWFNASSAFLRFLAFSGGVGGLLLIIGFPVLPRIKKLWKPELLRTLLLGLLWILYLSLITIGQPFTSFQWDFLLLESGFLALFLSSARASLGLIVFLFRFLLFKLIFMSGVVKLASGDQLWQNLTALTVHYETQPIPNPLSWYAHQLPARVHTASAAIMFFIELMVPFLFFAPRRLRFIGAGLTAFLQILIILTGNYTFFNLLTIFLCVFLLDDQALSAIKEWFTKNKKIRAREPVPVPETSSRHWLVTGVAFFLIIINLFHILQPLTGQTPGAIARTVQWIQPFGIANRYGLFAVMTNPRTEIIIEGSADGEIWRAYEFKYKPGALNQRPKQVAPHQPRLDWQIWFAALTSQEYQLWFTNLMVRLLQNSPDVLNLLENNPFRDEPPQFIRARRYEYHFTDYKSKKATDAWWTREFTDNYFPSIYFTNELN